MIYNQKKLKLQAKGKASWGAESPALLLHMYGLCFALWWIVTALQVKDTLNQTCETNA